MQTPVFIPATVTGHRQHYPHGRDNPAEFIKVRVPVVIVAFVGVAADSGPGGIYTGVEAIAYYTATGEMFNKQLRDFIIDMEPDLEPAAADAEPAQSQPWP